MSGCVICGSPSCVSHPDIPYFEDYPFLPGGLPRMPGDEDIEYVVAPHAIHDAELERNVYGAGDKVPMDDAVKYGLVDGPKKRKPAAKKQGRRARKPADNRVKPHGDNRASR